MFVLNCTKVVNFVKFRKQFKDIALTNFQYMITDALTNTQTTRKQNTSGTVLMVA